MRLLYASYLRIEDALVFVWVAFAEPGIMRPDGDGLRELTNEGERAGLFFIVAAAAAVVAIATRNPDEPTLAWTQRMDPRALAPYPLIVGIAVLAALGVENRGLAEAGVGFFLALVAAIVAYAMYEKLPSAPLLVRRLLLLPIVLAGVTIFNAIVHGLFAEVDDQLLTGAGFGVGLFAVIFSTMWFGVFIFPAGLIVEPDGSWRAWIARYALFFVGAVVGVSVSWPQIAA